MGKSAVQEPHNVEAEQAYLGSIIIEPTILSRAARLCRPADFFVEKHSFIFQAMLELDRAGQPLDTITLADQLGSQLEEIGGFSYLLGLSHFSPSALNMEYYAAIIRKYARLRRLIRGAGRIARLAHRAIYEPDEALALAESTILTLVKEERLGSVQAIKDLIRVYLDRVQQTTTPLGLSTGMAALDELCGRLQPADLVLLAGEPGTLKTALALSIIRSATQASRKVALFSLESSSEQIIQRLLATETNLTSQQLRLGDIGKALPELQEASARLAELELYIDDTPGLLVTELRSKARWLHYLWKLDLIVINYLQLLRPDQSLGSREQELAAISRALKALARELSIPILAVSILDPALGSDEVTRRGQGELRQLGVVQYEADLIWLCQKVAGRLLLTQARWRDGPEGVSIELFYDLTKHNFGEEAHGQGKTI